MNCQGTGRCRGCPVFSVTLCEFVVIQVMVLATKLISLSQTG